MLLELRQALALTLHHPRHGNARPLRDDLRHVLSRHLFLEESLPARLTLSELMLGLAQLRFELRNPPIGDLGRLAKIARACRLLRLGAGLLDLRLILASFWRDSFSACHCAFMAPERSLS